MKTIVLLQESSEVISNQQAVWNELNDKYSFRCDRPQNLYLFKARMPREIKFPTSSDRELIIIIFLLQVSILHIVHFVGLDLGKPRHREHYHIRIPMLAAILLRYVVLILE